MGVYLERCAKIRKKALEETGIEIDYVMATRSEMQGMSLIEKLEVLRMAKRQTAIGATISFSNYIQISCIIPSSFFSIIFL